MKNPSACLLACCLAVAGCQSLSTTSRVHASDVSAIRAVVEAFRTSLIDKDRARYMALFFSDQPADIGWQLVSEDTRLAHVRRKRPDAMKAPRTRDDHFIALIDEVVATPEPREETFSDVRIDTDGEIASVSFDYAYLENGTRSNWGREMWQLVRTERGWKIFSVVYSVRDRWSAGER